MPQINSLRGRRFESCQRRSRKFLFWVFLWLRLLHEQRHFLNSLELFFCDILTQYYLGTYIDVEEYRYLVRVVDHTLSTSYGGSSRDLISFSRHCSYIQHDYNWSYCVVVKEEAFLLWQFLNLIRTSSAEMFTWRLFHSNSSTAPLVFRKIYRYLRALGRLKQWKYPEIHIISVSDQSLLLYLQYIYISVSLAHFRSLQLHLECRH